MPKNSSQGELCYLSQGMDADMTVHLLAVAETHALPRLAERAEKYLAHKASVPEHVCLNSQLPQSVR